MTAQETPTCGSGLVAGLVSFTAVAQRPAAMTCARRLAGARMPATSTEPVPSLSRGSPSRPDPRPGRRRARFFLLLPALALLLGAFPLFTVAPAQAQTTVWSATLTVKQGVIDARDLVGCIYIIDPSCADNLSDVNFDYGGTNYDIEEFALFTNGVLSIKLAQNVPATFRNLILRVDNRAFSLAAARLQGKYVDIDNNGLSWSANQQVQLSLVVPRPPVQGNPQLSGLSLSVGGNPVTLTGGDPMGVPIGRYATVPRDATTLTVTPTWAGSGITATVSSQELHSRTVLTAPTAVTSGGSVGVTLAAGHRYVSEYRTYVYVELTHSSGRKAGHTVVVTKGGPLAASLSVSPNPVTEDDGTLGEGSKATVTVTLDYPLDTESDQVIPLSVTHGTSESGDWSIANAGAVIIRRGSRTGTTYIRALPDTDTASETLTVALGTLPSGFTAGTPSSVLLTITDSGSHAGLLGLELQR